MNHPVYSSECIVACQKREFKYDKEQCYFDLEFSFYLPISLSRTILSPPICLYNSTFTAYFPFGFLILLKYSCIL